MNGNGAKKALIGKQHTDHFSEGFRLFLRRGRRLAVLHKHQANEIPCGDDQHHDRDEEEPTLDVSRFDETVNCPSHGKAEHNARKKRNDFLGRREIRASLGVNVRIAPIEDHRRDEIISEISNQQASHNDHRAELLRNMEKRQ